MRIVSIIFYIITIDNINFHIYRSHKEVPFFDRKFYYEKADKAKCTFECYNDRIKSHFDEKEARKYGLLFEWDWMKTEYERYHTWNPIKQHQMKFDKSITEDDQEEMLQKLEKQTRKLKKNKFDFY